MMPVSNGTYTRGTQARVRGKTEKAAQNKERFSQSRFTIKFSRDSFTVEHIRKKG